MTILLDNVSTDVSDPSEIFVSKGGSAVVNVRASNYGGATIEIQTTTVQDGLDRWATLTDGSFTADRSVKLNYLPNGMSVRAIVSGTTGPSDGIFVDILQ